MVVKVEMKYYIIVFAYLLISCSNGKNNKPEDSHITPMPIDTLNSNGNKKSLRTEIINNEFANAPLGDFDFHNNILSSYFKEKYRTYNSTVQNDFTDDIDTLIYFQRAKSIVRFYKTKEKIFLDSLNVSDSNFVTLKGGLDIGMQKRDFLSYFKERKELYADTISVTNGENSSVSFLFVNGKLNKILIYPW